MNVTLYTEQSLYVIPCGDGYTCLGFDNARGHADQIAARLERPELASRPVTTARSTATPSTRRPSMHGAARG